MIAIINDGTNSNITGLHRYRVQINNELICEFDHVREDGLAECLRKAADAVEQAEEDRISDIISFAKMFGRSYVGKSELRYWEDE